VVSMVPHQYKSTVASPIPVILDEECDELERHHRAPNILQDHASLDFRHAALRGVGDETDVAKGDLGGRALYPERCRSDAQDDGGREGDSEHHSAIACEHRSYRPVDRHFSAMFRRRGACSPHTRTKWIPT